jgi:hypothetical protein
MLTRLRDREHYHSVTACIEAEPRWAESPDLIIRGTLIVQGTALGPSTEGFDS